VDSYELTNGSLVARISNFGATLTHLFVPDQNDQLLDVVLGFDTPEEYQETKNPMFYGCVCGRFANRIAGGKFSLDGKDYQLPINNGPNHLHGGPEGFHQALFTAKKSTDMIGQHLTLTHVSPDGDEGYPGEVSLTIVYTVPNHANELRISYQATTTEKTLLNLTNHSYFNLNGVDAGKDILNHEAQFTSERFTPSDDDSIPTGEVMAQLDEERGFDHNFVIEENLEAQPEGPRLFATLSSPESGIEMEVLTDQPGFQFYLGGYLNNSAGKGGTLYPQQHGFCIETQNLPDAPNQCHQPDLSFAKRSILLPEESYTIKNHSADLDVEVVLVHMGFRLQSNEGF